jgi:hypothetical protein
LRRASWRAADSPAGQRQLDCDLAILDAHAVHESQVDQVLAELRVDHLAQRVADHLRGDQHS